jgi:hypothetical protein|eukprot:COSAG02_NODE_2576_length_8498_cov_4.245386_7_plen_48_part_00
MNAAWVAEPTSCAGNRLAHAGRDRRTHEKMTWMSVIAAVSTVTSYGS